MTSEQQRIAIAEWCGWEWWTHPEGTPKLSRPRDDQERNYWLSCGCITCNGPGRVDSKVPDYLNDLNAMHEAEGKLTTIPWAKGWGLFIGQLIEVTQNHSIEGKGLIHATAAQRAEALLRTIGKWIDQQKAPTEAGAETL